MSYHEWIDGDSVPGGSGGSEIPSSLLRLVAYSAPIIAFITNPIDWLWKHVAPLLVDGIIGLATPFIDGILFVFLGKEGMNQTPGLAELPVFIAGRIANGLLGVVVALGDALITVNEGIIPTLPGPIDAILITGLFVVEVVVIVEVGRRATRALLDSIPVVSGIETFLFSGGSGK